MKALDSFNDLELTQTAQQSQHEIPKLKIQNDEQQISGNTTLPVQQKEHLDPFYNVCKLNFVNNSNNIKITAANEEASQKENNPSTPSKKNSIATIPNEEKDQQQWQKLDEILKRIKFKTYIKKFLLQSRKRLYRLLNIHQVKIINDPSNFFVSGGTNGKAHTLLQKTQLLFIPKFLRKAIANIPIFQPNNTLLGIWQVIKIVCIIICFYFYLISFAFNISIESIIEVELNYVCQICLAIDIIVNLNTAIYLKGQLTNNRKFIYQQYQKSLALYSDILQFICFLIYIFLRLSGYASSRSIQALLLPIVFKLNDLNIIIKKLKNRFLLEKKTQNAFELISLLKNILLISHIFACIWVLTAKLYDEQESQYINQDKDGSIQSDTQNWIKLMNIELKSWPIQYLYAYYFITVTMITVGYGDVKPTNPLEVGVCVVLMMTCCLIFGFTINSIGEIFQDIFSKEKNILQKRCIIANYMQRKDISSSIQKCVFEYLEYYWREELDESLEEIDKILNQLSNNLKQELFLESNKLVLKDNKILKEYFSNEILTKCLPIIQEQNCTPGEVVIDDQVGNVDGFLYFVQFGELEVYQSTSKGQSEFNIIKRLQKGNNFGQRSFFSGERKSLGVRSINFSTLLKIKRTDFLQVLKLHQNDFETYCMIKDRIILSDFHSQLHEKCTSCGEITHNETSCPVVHFIPKKFKIISQNQMSISHDNRVDHKRFYQKKQNSWLYLEYNLMRYYEYLENQLFQIENYEYEHLEYQFFKKNISMNDLDEITQKEHSIQASLQQQTIPFSQTTKDTTLNESIQQQYQSKRKLTFIQKLQPNKNLMLSQKKSSEIEDRDEVSSKNLSTINQYDQIDIEKEIAQNINQNRLSFSKSIQNNIQKDQQIRKRKYTVLQNSQQIPDPDRISFTDLGSPKQMEKQQSHKRQSQYQNQQFSSKEFNITEFISKFQKHPDLINQAVQNLKNLDEKSNNHQIGNRFSILRQMIPEFDIFLSEFEQLCIFKNYFPLFNYKEVIKQINESQQNQKDGATNQQKGAVNNQKKQSRIRRNGQRLSFNNQKYKQPHKSPNKPIYSPSTTKNYDVNTLKSSSQKKLTLIKQPKNQDRHELLQHFQQDTFKLDDSKLVESTSNYNISYDQSINNALLKEIKIEIETPRQNEEQTHLRKQPSIWNIKKFYLSDKTNETQDFYRNPSEILFSNKKLGETGLTIITKEIQ